MQDLFEPIVTIILLIIFSIFGRILLEKIGQRWVTTFAHTTTIILLPVITFMITKVIAGNIALSLGMVGALSASILNAANLGNYVADTEQEYIKITQELYSKGKHTKKRRERFKKMVMESNLNKPENISRGLEKIYRELNI